MNKRYLYIIIGILTALIVVFLVLNYLKKDTEINFVLTDDNVPGYKSLEDENINQKDNENSYIPSQNTTYSPATDPRITGFKENLISISVAPGSSVSGVFTIYCTVTKDFYDQMDGVSVVFLDSNNSWMTDSSTGAGFLWTPNQVAVIQRTPTEVSFSVMVDASDAVKGPGYVSIAQSDGASGRAKRFSIPVVFQ